ncbi:IS903D transposase [Klebsiella variicola]|nr:IS903D transposase [Klebsiella variicola]
MYGQHKIYLFNNARSVAKKKFKITNWPIYNKALINRGSLTFWLDDEAIQALYESEQRLYPGKDLSVILALPSPLSW